LEDYLKPLYLLIMKKPLEMSPSRSAFPSKVIAGIYGIVCIGTAFLAQHVGGILQVSLTIFGVVGGPLLGLFTLGMGMPEANEKGSITGLFAGIIISMWIGFGKPKPPPVYLDFSTDDCSQFGLYNVTRSIPPSIVSQESQYFYLYKLSYLYSVVIGFFVTFFIGILASRLLKSMNYVGTDKIYKDQEKKMINYDLFFPPVARRLRIQNTKRERLLSTSNNILNLEIKIPKV